MAAIAIGFVLGLTLGMTTGTEGGALAGAMLGLLAGAAYHGIGWVWAHTGDQPTVERHRLMCRPRGAFADVVLVGDVGRRRWLDVQACSLEGDKVDCEKNCLRLISLSQKPGQPCSCGAAQSSTQ